MHLLHIAFYLRLIMVSEIATMIYNAIKGHLRPNHLIDLHGVCFMMIGENCKKKVVRSILEPTMHFA